MGALLADVGGMTTLSPTKLSARSPLALRASASAAPTSVAGAPAVGAGLKRVDQVAVSAPFRFDAPELPDLRAARTWAPGKPGLRGGEANAVVNATYTALDESMSAYLGSPALPNWMSFGKYASREAGGQLLRLEEAIDALQGGKLDALIDTFQNAGGAPVDATMDGVRLMVASYGNPVKALKGAKVLHSALVWGNTGVYGDIAPAYAVFLKGEAEGGKGLQALQAAGYGQGEKDPQGLLLEAFRCYHQAQRVGAATPEAEAQRKALVARGTLLLGVHEQMVILQAPQVFGNPEVAKVLDRMGKGAMVLHEPSAPGGKRVLLPQGGNWSTFATRMGFEAVPPGTERPSDVQVRDHFGTLHRYRVSEDPKRLRGTISELFAQGLEPKAAAALLNNRPRPLPAEYLDGNDFQKLWDGVTGAFSSFKRKLLGAAPESPSWTMAA